MSTAKSSKPLPSCDICGKTFHSTNSVTLHKRIHSRGQRHKCEHCHKTFIYQGTLDTHIRYTHNKGGDGILLFRCSYCERRFDTKNGLRVHISMSHYDFKRFKCEKCGERFKTSQNLTYHMYSHGAKRPAYECRLCHAKMATVKSYMNHMALHNDGVFTCKICKKTFDDKSKHASHCITHKKHKCLFCQRIFNSKQIMVIHIKESHQRDIIKHLTCTECGDNFDDESRLCSHMINTHWKEEGKYDDHVNKSDKCRFTCDTCGDSFATRFILKHHINDKHFDGALLDSEEREKCQRPKTKGMVNMRKNTPLNLRILQDFEVATAMLKPSMLDPENNVNYYVCEVCLTTYAYKLSLIHHIKYAASKHAIYLRKKTSSESDAKVTLTEILNTSFKSSDPSSEPIKQKTDLESEKREDDKAQSIHLQPQQQLQNEGQTHETHTCDEVCKVTDVRSIKNDFSLDTSSTDIVKPTMMNNTTDEKADEHSNSDEKQTHLNKDDLDADDMQPLYTARPLLPEEYISTGLENYRGMLNEQDNTENVTDDRVTNDSSEGGNDTHSYENSSEAIMTNENGEIAGTQAYTFTPDDVNCSGKQADMKTNETTMLTSQIIPFQNQSFKVPHRCTIPQDVSADLSPHSSASEISNSKQCGTIRQLPSDFQNCLQCCLCNEEFCINCSGLPVDTYKVLLRCKEECHSGLFWTCDKCQGLVPKLSVMLSTLENFDQHINSRLKKMEETLSVVKQKYGTNQ